MFLGMAIATAGTAFVGSLIVAEMAPAKVSGRALGSKSAGAPGQARPRRPPPPHRSTERNA